ncbi:hypothetical protein SAZ10_17060 [Mesorhizobium sp. BAC0120]|uniref:hypothetical protein n=1 Tax=Mesorhizobium sp. BAC0120 TaxID=3090670 RepID=UPI00298CD7D7|nr:hypothetical protein [Mesorhizobium sp. BAC0120]MDW6023461.1 hypothetical protein [Mesorhizobium sp. BAC0120]
MNPDLPRIGILAEEGCAVFSWASTRSAIAASGAEMLFLIERPTNRYRRRLRDLPARAAWRLLLNAECLLAGQRQPPFDPGQVMLLACRFKGHFKDFSDEEIARIKAADIDLIIRLGGRGIYRGAMLTAARHGIISIHHGDNRAFRGGPPGFWEIVEGAPRSGYIVQRLTSTLDGGEVLARGDVVTAGYIGLNRKNLFAAADEALCGVVEHFIAHRRLPDPEPPLHELGPIYKMPNLRALGRYCWKVWMRGERRNARGDNV